MHILAVFQFVFILEPAGNVQIAFFVKPAAVSCPDAGKSVPGIGHHSFFGYGRFVMVALHHLRAVHHDFAIRAVFPDTGFIDNYLRVSESLADRAIFIASAGRVV